MTWLSFLHKIVVFGHVYFTIESVIFLGLRLICSLGHSLSYPQSSYEDNSVFRQIKDRFEEEKQRFVWFLFSHNSIVSFIFVESIRENAIKHMLIFLALMIFFKFICC